MNVFVLLAFIPSLIAADILCPNSKTTCPEGKHCCEVDGEYSCCDPDDEQNVPDIRVKVYPGDDLLSLALSDNSNSFNQTKLAYCDFMSCRGTCCAEGCCEYYSATCCGNSKCCPAFNDCCSTGCCGAFQKCCGDGCCDSDATCCGTWCCKKGHRCGSRYRTCRSKGIMISFDMVVLILMAMTAFVSRRL